MLNGFSSYFEIFALLNLGFAGSKFFRDKIDEQIESINSISLDYINGKKKKIKDEMIVAQGDEISTKLSSASTRFNAKITKIEEYKKKWVCYKYSFKPMFLASSIYCFIALLLGGFESIYCTEEGDYKIITFSIIVISPILAYLIFQFFRSFHLSLCSRKTESWKIVMIYLVLIASGVVAIGFKEDTFFISEIVDKRYYLLVSLIIPILPFLLYYLRTIMHKWLIFLLIAFQVVKMYFIISKVERFIDFLKKD